MKSFTLIIVLLCPFITSFGDEGEPELSVRVIGRQVLIGVIDGAIGFTFSCCIVIPIASRFLPTDGNLCKECITGQPVVIRALRLVLGSVMEEVFFRCYLQPRLSDALCHRLCDPQSSNDISLANHQHCIASDLSLHLTNTFFGACHLLNPGRPAVQAFSSTVSGYFYSYIYDHHGSIAVMTSHVTHNLLWFSLIYYFHR